MQTPASRPPAAACRIPHALWRLPPCDYGTAISRPAEYVPAIIPVSTVADTTVALSVPPRFYSIPALSTTCQGTAAVSGATVPNTGLIRFPGCATISVHARSRLRLGNCRTTDTCVPRTVGRPPHPSPPVLDPALPPGARPSGRRRSSRHRGALLPQNDTAVIPYFKALPVRNVKSGAGACRPAGGCLAPPGQIPLAARTTRERDRRVGKRRRERARRPHPGVPDPAGARIIPTPTDRATSVSVPNE